ncbi:hypothetical protein O9992_23850 [Vibrio lentus]|nr:hypothetical protein [Vibrio lentus]
MKLDHFSQPLVIFFSPSPVFFKKQNTEALLSKNSMTNILEYFQMKQALPVKLSNWVLLWKVLVEARFKPAIRCHLNGRKTLSFIFPDEYEIIENSIQNTR